MFPTKLGSVLPTKVYQDPRAGLDFRDASIYFLALLAGLGFSSSSSSSCFDALAFPASLADAVLGLAFTLGASHGSVFVVAGNLCAVSEMLQSRFTSKHAPQHLHEVIKRSNLKDLARSNSNSASTALGVVNPTKSSSKTYTLLPTESHPLRLLKKRAESLLVPRQDFWADSRVMGRCRATV